MTDMRMRELDVERLAKALHETYCRRRSPMHSDRLHSAARIAAEYARLGALAEVDSAASAEPAMSVAMSDADEGPA